MMNSTKLDFFIFVSAQNQINICGGFFLNSKNTEIVNRRQKSSRPDSTKLKKEADKEIKFLTQEQLERLFAVIRKANNVRDIAIFNVSYYCGLRASEVALLRYDDWMSKTNCIYIHRLKRSENISMILDSARGSILRKYLKEYIPDTAYSPLFPSRGGKNGISRYRLHQLMKIYGAQANLPLDKRHFHVLRHSIAVHMLDSGADIADVRRVLGHRSLAVTYIYAKYTKRRQSFLHTIMNNSKFIAK